MTPSRILRLAPVAAAGLLVASCADDSPVSSTPDSPPVLAIDGAEFLSESVEGFTLVEGTVLRLSFDGGNLGADAGCNSMGGSYTVDDGVLSVSSLMQTEMYCDGLMEQESWYGELLTASPTVTQDGDRLTLTTADATVVFLDREVADPDRPLEGTDWTIDTIIDADAVSSVGAVGTILLADGTATVDTGCNRGSAPYEIVDGGVSFGELALTKMACADDGAAQLEAQFVAVLTGEVTVEIEADSITIMNGAAGLGGRSDA